MEKAFVGFFDVLGFKNLVEKNSHNELIEIYNLTFSEIFESYEQYFQPIFYQITPELEKDCLDIKIFIISDSIILIQSKITETGLLAIISTCQFLLSMAMANGIPLRGALSYGSVSVINTGYGTSIVGKGLTNAFNIEKRQMWSGGIIDRICFNEIPKANDLSLVTSLLNAETNLRIVEYDVPLKQELTSKEYVFDWTEHPLLTSEIVIKNSFFKHNKNISDQNANRIVENTIIYFNKRNNKK